MDEPVFIIAEAGVSHFGDLKKAFQLVDMAVSAHADAVKFQIFHTDDLISSAAPEWKDRYRSKELTLEDFSKIKQYCMRKGIIFLSTAHDDSSLKDLDTIGVAAYKIGSGEVHNWPFLKLVAQRKKPILLSTGMYMMEDIRTALEIITSENNSQVALLHCTTAYPTPPSQVNLMAIRTIQSEFGGIVGYSDHTSGYHFPLAAVAIGAKIIEKHITLDFNIPNAQDWKVSCGPETLPKMVKEIRQIEQGLGTGLKVPQELEKESLKWARKSITASTDIMPEEVITIDKITMKRPGTGIPPSKLEQVIGRKARSFIKSDTLILWEQLK
jgi:N,N'-diacetyllegionaminate synthase